MAAMAQSMANPYASASVEYDSNVHRLPNSQAAQTYYGDPTLADWDTKIIAGIEDTYLWGQQKFIGKVEARRFQYNHFTDLDHFEYLADLALNWKLSRLFDGLLEFHDERFAAPFVNNNSTTLEVNTDRNIVGNVKYNFTRDWRLDAGVNFHTLSTPLQLYPDYAQHETGSHLGISYLGVANLSYGIAYDHLSGNFSYAPDVGPYSQSSGSFKVNYVLSGLDSLNGAIGYSRRNQTVGNQIGNDNGSVSAVTGSLGYTRQLTGKTSFWLQVVRAINSYAAAGGSEVDTSATMGLSWQATYRLNVSASGGYMRSTFAGQVIPGSTATGRYDHSPSGGLNITYDVLRRLRIKAFFVRQSRSSNYELYSFGDTFAGIQATTHWR
jgi:hypothetical protein